MLKIRGTDFLLVIGFVVMTSGCGGGGSSKPGTIVPLSASQTISELTPADYQTICRNLNDRVVDDSTKLGICTLSGILFGRLAAESENLVQGCNSFVTQCLAAAQEDDDDTAESCVVRTDASLVACQHTVGELETCIQEYIRVARVQLQNLDCAIADNDAEVELAVAGIFGLPPTTECARIQADCPEIFQAAAKN